MVHIAQKQNVTAPSSVVNQNILRERTIKMAYYTYTKDPIGCFVEKDTGNTFEYSLNDEDPLYFFMDYPHKVWVGGGGVAGMTGWRYAHVRKTVAVIVVDEDEFGLPVTEKWHLKKNDVYFGQ